MRDLSVKTLAGLTLRINEAGNTCGVDGLKDASGASVAGKWSDIPNIIFVGGLFRMEIEEGRYILVDSSDHKIKLPYRLVTSDRIRYLSLHCRDATDQFPVMVRCFPEPARSIEFLRRGGRASFIVIDSAVAREDVVAIKKQRPGAGVIVVRASDIYLKDSQSGDEDREGESSAGEGLSFEVSQNPVFLARLYLRNVDVKKVKQLLLNFKMSMEEMEFVRTFLHMMIRNDKNDPLLSQKSEELTRLNEIFRLSEFLIGDQKADFDSELEKGVDPRIAEELAEIVAFYRAKVDSKEDEIQYWEWEYRLKKIADSSGG